MYSRTKTAFILYLFYLPKKNMQVWDQDFVFGDDKNICVLSHKSAPS